MENKEIEMVTKSVGLECWSPREVMAQIQAIQHLMKEGMKENEHFGVIPGTNSKPALLKPGAEKLGLMFRLAGKYETQEASLPNGHLDVRVKCSLYHIVTGHFWGEGLGSCSTMESKYRYRSGVGESTGVKVPKEYWDLRRTDPKAAQDIIGKGFTTKKDPDTGIWYIMEKIDKVENPDIADIYNTVRKMAKKRAFVDAMLSATAASDIFTQDIIDEPIEAKKDEKQAVPQPPPNEGGSFITHDEQLEIHRQLKSRGIAPTALKEALKQEFGVSGTAKITPDQYPKVIEWIIRHDSAAVVA